MQIIIAFPANQVLGDHAISQLLLASIDDAFHLKNGISILIQLQLRGLDNFSFSRDERSQETDMENRMNSAMDR